LSKARRFPGVKEIKKKGSRSSPVKVNKCKVLLSKKHHLFY
jgi:hypothetical protein